MIASWIKWRLRLIQRTVAYNTIKKEKSKPVGRVRIIAPIEAPKRIESNKRGAGLRINLRNKKSTTV
jgi:hypothetical protein